MSVICKNKVLGDRFLIRLRDGADQYEGRLEVFYNGTWGTVCDDSFGIQEARMACKQLGYALVIVYKYDYK